MTIMEIRVPSLFFQSGDNAFFSGEFEFNRRPDWGKKLKEHKVKIICLRKNQR